MDGVVHIVDDDEAVRYLLHAELVQLGLAVDELLHLVWIFDFAELVAHGIEFIEERLIGGERRHYVLLDGKFRVELRLLLELSRRPGQALSRQQLLRLVWEHDYLGDSRLVDACVQRLRAKVEDVPSSPKLIRTVRGVGYRLDAPQ